MLNKYNRIARIYPAILSSLPIFVLNYFLLDAYTADFVNSLKAVTWIGGISFSVVLIYLFGQIGRLIGKEFFEKKYFIDEISMPTTNYLLHMDLTYTPDLKKKIHSKIFNDFGIELYSPEQEEKDILQARKIIVECISLIRAKVKDGRLVLKHNYEYGFSRNFAGGSVVGLCISLINLFLFGQFFVNYIAFNISFFFAICYLAAIFSGGFSIKWHGARYAKVLIQEYLTTQ